MGLTVLSKLMQLSPSIWYRNLRLAWLKFVTKGISLCRLWKVFSFGKISVLMDSDRSRSVDTGRGCGPLAPRTRGPHYSGPPTDPWPWHWAPQAICVGVEKLDLSIHTGSRHEIRFSTLKRIVCAKTKQYSRPTYLQQCCQTVELRTKIHSSQS